jgi:hypothetical protein
MAEELSGQVTSAIDTLHRDVETSIIQASLGVAPPPKTLQTNLRINFYMKHMSTYFAIAIVLSLSVFYYGCWDSPKVPTSIAVPTWDCNCNSQLIRLRSRPCIRLKGSFEEFYCVSFSNYSSKILWKLEFGKELACILVSKLI